MRYYAQMINGERKPITEWVYMLLVNAHGWRHVIRDVNLEIIEKGRTQ